MPPADGFCSVWFGVINMEGMFLMHFSVCVLTSQALVGCSALPGQFSQTINVTSVAMSQLLSL
jgi:hypothetical protein